MINNIAKTHPGVSMVAGRESNDLYTEMIDSEVSLICGQVNEPSGTAASRLPKGGVRCSLISCPVCEVTIAIGWLGHVPDAMTALSLAQRWSPWRKSSTAGKVSFLDRPKLPTVRSPRSARLVRQSPRLRRSYDWANLPRVMSVTREIPPRRSAGPVRTWPHRSPMLPLQLLRDLQLEERLLELN